MNDYAEEEIRTAVTRIKQGTGRAPSLLPPVDVGARMPTRRKVSTAYKNNSNEVRGCSCAFMNVKRTVSVLVDVLTSVAVTRWG